MTDRIGLTGLRMRGFHGVFEHERRDGQDFLVDVVLELDTRPAAHSDRLADTVDYGGLATGLAGVISGSPVDLLETLAARLAAVCLSDQRVEAATVTVHKPQAPIPLSFTDVAVTIRRTRADDAPLSHSSPPVRPGVRPGPPTVEQRGSATDEPEAFVGCSTANICDERLREEPEAS